MNRKVIAPVFALTVTLIGFVQIIGPLLGILATVVVLAVAIAIVRFGRFIDT